VVSLQGAGQQPELTSAHRNLISSEIRRNFLGGDAIAARVVVLRGRRDLLRTGSARKRGLNSRFQLSLSGLNGTALKTRFLELRT